MRDMKGGDDRINVGYLRRAVPWPKRNNISRFCHVNVALCKIGNHKGDLV